MAGVIIEASSAADYEAFAALVRDYVEWCRRRYSDLPWFVDETMRLQSLDGELQTLPVKYRAPNGAALLASRDGEIAGAVAYRRLSQDVCEMKRLFVAPKFHGLGAARQLCEALFAKARGDGFSTMRLDTGHLFLEAQKLYRSMGFVDCAPYNAYPEPIARYMVFMEKSLTAPAP